MPSTDIAEAIEERVKKDQKEVKRRYKERMEALRKHEEDQIREREHRDQATQDLHIVNSWCEGKTLVNMLEHAHEILPGLCPPIQVDTSNGVHGVRRAFMLAAKHLHPDKISRETDPTIRLTAEAVFSKMQTEYELVRDILTENA